MSCIVLLSTTLSPYQVFKIRNFHAILLQVSQSPKKNMSLLSVTPAE